MDQLFSKRKGAAALVAAVLLVASCTGLPQKNPRPFPIPGGTKILSNVPFYPQESYQCGPAALSSVMNYYGKALYPNDIAEAIYDPNRRGTLTLDLVLFARKNGFDARWYSSRPSDLLEKIDNAHPQVVLVDLGLGPIRRPHFMVVFGYSPEGVIAHSGRKEGTLVRWTQFLQQWKRSDFWALSAIPEKAL